MQLWHYWLLAALILLISEMFTPGFLLATFAVGAVAASITALLGLGFGWQLIIMAVVSVVAFYTLRPMVLKSQAKRKAGGTAIETNVDALVGRTGRVETNIDDGVTGQVKVGGEVWSAIGENDTAIEAGKKIKVLRVDGSKLIVTALTESEQGN